jgi:hypothetical protein
MQSGIIAETLATERMGPHGSIPHRLEVIQSVADRYAGNGLAVSTSRRQLQEENLFQGQNVFTFFVLVLSTEHEIRTATLWGRASDCYVIDRADGQFLQANARAGEGMVRGEALDFVEGPANAKDKEHQRAAWWEAARGKVGIGHSRVLRGWK